MFTMRSVSGPAGQWKEMQSASATASSRLAKRLRPSASSRPGSACGSKKETRKPNALALPATAMPTLPRPTSSSRLPAVRLVPAATSRSASMPCSREPACCAQPASQKVRRYRFRMKARAESARSCTQWLGVFSTAMPSSSAARTSTLSVEAPMRTSALSRLKRCRSSLPSSMEW